MLMTNKINRDAPIHLLPDYHIADAVIYTVLQNKHLQRAKIRAFIDFMSGRL